jgi:hypothetical protein
MVSQAVVELIQPRGGSWGAAAAPGVLASNVCNMRATESAVDAIEALSAFTLSPVAAEQLVAGGALVPLLACVGACWRPIARLPYLSVRTGRSRRIATSRASPKSWRA